MRAITVRCFASKPQLKVLKFVQRLDQAPSPERQPQVADVVSSKLCDDVVRRIAPSLEGFQGCDIIDINPGICMFSTKIHEALKPRHHILVEPHQSLYQPYLKPLLEQPNSSYQCVDWNPLYFSNYVRFFDEGYLPEQARQQPTTNAGQVVKNGSLLFLANLGYTNQISSLYRGPVSSYLLNKFLNAMYTNSLFHRYGLVRMLVWIHDKDKYHYVPRNVHARRRRAVLTESAVSATELAGLDHDPRAGGTRDYDLLLEDCERVAGLMRKRGVTVPKGRQLGVPEPPSALFRADAKGFEALKQKKSTTDWQREMLDLLESLHHNDLSEIDSAGVTVDRRRTSKEAKRFSTLKTKMNTENREYAATKLIATKRQELDNLEKQVRLGKTTKSKDSLLKWSHNLSREIAQKKPKLLRDIQKIVDDRRAYHQRPPLLAWDRRQSEPLRVNDNEFTPKGALALLDLEPNLEHVTALRDEENLLCYEYVCNALFSNPTASVWEAMDFLTFGNAQGIIDAAPSLRDPTKCGMLDLRDTRVRTLPVATIIDLALAWAKWPFRPTLTEMRNRMASLGSKTLAEMAPKEAQGLTSL